MEAKDTVMSPNTIRSKQPVNDRYAYYQSFGEAIAQAQAEISFKAGEDKGYNEGVDDGREEVVGWIIEQDKQVPGYITPEKANKIPSRMRVPWSKWQTKLKEWGINKETQ